MSAQIDRLFARVRWIDRWKRLVAVGIAVLVTAGLILAFKGGAAVLSIAVGIGVWLIVEVGFAYLAARWETDHETLARSRGLPQAILRPRRASKS